MINLDKQLCDELGITFWQLREQKNSQNTEKQIDEEAYQLNREDKELLRNILLAKGIMLQDEMLSVFKDGSVKVKLTTHCLNFNDVNLADSATEINLAKISAMHSDKNLKKLTWFKLKNLNLA